LIDTFYSLYFRAQVKESLPEMEISEVAEENGNVTGTPFGRDTFFRF